MNPRQLPSAEEITVQSVEGWFHGKAIFIDVMDVECGRLLRKDVAHQFIDAMVAARFVGIRISISSAFRTYAEQERLYNGWKAGLAGFNPADPPGHSKHQEGVAVDLHFASGEKERDEFYAIAVAHGFTRPHPGEPWHFDISPQGAAYEPDDVA